MLSFLQFILEKTEPLPKAKGWVDHKVIDGHHVHVRFHKTVFGEGKYRALMTVNGKLHTPESLASKFEPETSRKILHFTRSATTNFLKDRNPVKVKIKATTKKKERLYQTFGKSKAVGNLGYQSKNTLGGVTLNKPENRPVHQPAPYVKRDYENHAHDDSEHKAYMWKKIGFSLKKLSW